MAQANDRTYAKFPGGPRDVRLSGSIIDIDANRSEGHIKAEVGDATEIVGFSFRDVLLDKNHLSALQRGLTVTFVLGEDHSGSEGPRNKALQVMPVEDMQFRGFVSKMDHKAGVGEVIVEELSTRLNFRAVHTPAPGDFQRLRVGSVVRVEIKFCNFIVDSNRPEIDAIIPIGDSFGAERHRSRSVSDLTSIGVADDGAQCRKDLQSSSPKAHRRSALRRTPSSGNVRFATEPGSTARDDWGRQYPGRSRSHDEAGRHRGDGASGQGHAPEGAAPTCCSPQMAPRYGFYPPVQAGFMPPAEAMAGLPYWVHPPARPCMHAAGSAAQMAAGIPYYHHGPTGYTSPPVMGGYGSQNNYPPRQAPATEDGEEDVIIQLSVRELRKVVQQAREQNA